MNPDGYYRKFVGMEVHQATISVAVRDETGKLVMESILETKAGTILEFLQGLRGNLWIAFEEGTSAAWLYDLVKPHVARVVVCDPRKNALLKAGKARMTKGGCTHELSELLRADLLTPVYHGESGVSTLRELGRSYLTLTKDLTRVRNRLKALYRSWAIPCAGEKSLFPAPPESLAGTTLASRACVVARSSSISNWDSLLVAAAPSKRGGSSWQRARSTSRPSAAPTDSTVGSDPRGLVDRSDPDPAAFPDQATALGLCRGWRCRQRASERRISPVARADTSVCIPRKFALLRGSESQP